MRKMSEKTQKFLKALDEHPEASVSSLAKKHKIAPAYAYKLAKKQIRDHAGPLLDKLAIRPFETKVVEMGLHQDKAASTLFKVDLNTPIEDPKPATELEIAKLLGLPANEIQVGGEHYKKNAIQPWDYIVSNQLGYLEGNVVKYVSRWKDKGGRQDLEKAKHYLDKLLEVA